MSVNQLRPFPGARFFSSFSSPPLGSLVLGIMVRKRSPNTFKNGAVKGNIPHVICPAGR